MQGPTYPPYSSSEGQPYSEQGGGAPIEEEFKDLYDLNIENVKRWLSQTAASFKSIENIPPEGRVYYDEGFHQFLPSVEGLKKRVSELKAKDSFVYSVFGETAGSVWGSILDSAQTAAEKATRVYYKENWKTTISGFDNIQSDFYANLDSVDDLVANDPAVTRKNLKELRSQVDALKNQILNSTAGMRNLEKAYGEGEKGGEIKERMRRFTDTTLERIDETLEQLNERINQLKEKIPSKEPEAFSEEREEKIEAAPFAQEAVEPKKPLVEIISYGVEEVPQSLEVKEEKVEEQKEMPPLVEEEQPPVEVEEEIKIKEEMPSLVEEERPPVEVEQEITIKEEMPPLVEEEKAPTEFEKGEEKSQDELIKKLEDLVLTTQSQVPPQQIRPTSMQAIATFNMNGKSLKDVLNNLPRGMVLAMMVFTVNQWKLRKNVMSEEEAPQAYRIASQVVDNLSINNKKFDKIVADLPMNKLILLKNCLVNYFYTRYPV